MKKWNYSEPQFDVVKFCENDILLASELTGFNPNASEGGGWNTGNGNGNSSGFAL